MKKSLLLSVCLLTSLNVLFAREYSVKSPDNQITVTVNIGADIKWSALYNGKELIKATRIGLELKSGKILGENERLKKNDLKRFNDVIRAEVPYKRSEILDNYNILELTFKSGFSLQFRAYNDGIAYRFKTEIEDELTIRNEIAELDFPADTHSWFPLEQSFFSHNERTFIYSSLDTIDKDHLASLPALFKTKDINVLITESDITDYPGMWLVGRGSGKISGIWPKFPDKEQIKDDRNMVVTGTKNYLAETIVTREFPWRVFIISPDDAGLISNDLVYRLATPCKLEDTGWIKPGQVAWDWWNANNIYGVNFSAGINNDTYKYYIDFASTNRLDYIILDEGWYENTNVTDEAEGINIYDLCRYGEEKKVGIILWVTWKSLDDRMEDALSLYEKWGVKGIKVDFMQRDDQKMVNFYRTVAESAANHHLLVDFHGAYKPDGLSRTFPNILTREGVKGMEWCKWSREVGPEHDATLPFTRMVAGAMDYTPGAMVNMDSVSFSPSMTRPESQGTRAHQVALYVIFESPLQMLSDSPSNYMKEQETTDFISNIPVTWDDIACLDGKVGDYVLLARRSGKEWFAGAITDWSERDFDVDFSFLPSGNYKIIIFQDGINADRYASDYDLTETNIKAGDRMRIHLAPGGGWAARIIPVE
jgi:alpha-glucosidase